MSGYKHQKEARARREREGLTTRVLRVRIKDKHVPFLRKLAAEVNLVWNYCNEMSQLILRREGRFVSMGELDAMTAGATKEGLLLHSQTVQAVNAEYVTRRRQFRRAKLRWRISDPRRSNYSLGWIPFKKSAIVYRNGQVFLAGAPLSLWDSYGLADYALRSGTISEDARGRWYLNVTVEVKKKPRNLALLKTDAAGYDLGLKDFLTDSDGNKVEAQRFYRDLEPKIAVAQRAGKKDRVRALHAKGANRRKDTLHKISTQAVRTRTALFVGNANASALAQTSMAKSVLDAGSVSYTHLDVYKRQALRLGGLLVRDPTANLFLAPPLTNRPPLVTNHERPAGQNGRSFRKRSAGCSSDETEQPTANQAAWVCDCDEELDAEAFVRRRESLFEPQH